jgi:hypothetical protein
MLGARRTKPMSPSRFEYSEICPTCKEAGAVDEATGKTFNLGFDIDTSRICCLNGHEFDRLPSDAVAKASDSEEHPSQNSATPELQADATKVSEGRNTSLREEATSEAVSESKTEAVEGRSEGAFGHSLGEVSESGAQTGAQEDSAALARISEQLSPVSPEVQTLAVQTGAQPEYGLPGRVMLTQPETGTMQMLVAEGRELTLPNGDVLFGLVVPEQWSAAVRAESEIQNQTAAEYLQQWFREALENFWVSNYSQSR